MKLRKDYRTVLFLCVAAALFLMLPQIMRFQQGNDNLAGTEPYFHARLAEHISENRMVKEDSMIYGGRNILYTPYHFAAAGMSFIMDIWFALRILPMICGIISVFLFYMILKRLSYERFVRIAAVLILVSSPAFVYVFTSSQDSLAIALTLFGAYLFLDIRRWARRASAIFFLGASFFSIFNALVIIALLLAHSFIKKKERMPAAAISAGLLSVSWIMNLPFFYNLSVGTPHILKSAVSDLGGMRGVGVFCIMLAVLGVSYSWRENKKYYPVYIMLLGYAAAFYFVRGHVMGYMNFFIALFAALGVKMIKDIEWSMSMIKNLTFILIVCGLVFSSVSYSARIAEMPPNEKIKTGLEWLKQNSREQDIVISHYSNGYFIEYYASRQVIMDSYITDTGEFNRRYLDSHTLFNSFEMRKSEEILKDYGIAYIAVTREMKEGLVWDSTDEAFITLLNDPETFKRIYSSDEIEIWRYLKKSR